MRTKWIKLDRSHTKTEYRVTVAKLSPRRTRGWDSAVYGDGTWSTAILGLIFGIDSCVNVYANGFLVERRWAGRGLNSPKRVAERIMRSDSTDRLQESVTYTVRCSRS